MAMGKRKGQQQEAWIATTDLPRSPAHPFCRKLNQLLTGELLPADRRPVPTVLR